MDLLVLKIFFYMKKTRTLLMFRKQFIEYTVNVYFIIDLTRINCVHILTLIPPSLFILNYLNFQPLEVVSRFAIHNLKWLKITHICLI